jgi:membrane protein
MITAVLFLIGRYLLETYLSRASLAAHVGNAATSLAVLLVWVYYSSMIILFGAEFTKAWLNKYADGIIPTDGAVRVERTLVRSSDLAQAKPKRELKTKQEQKSKRKPRRAR